MLGILTFKTNPVFTSTGKTVIKFVEVMFSEGHFEEGEGLGLSWLGVVNTEEGIVWPDCWIRFPSFNLEANTTGISASSALDGTELLVFDLGIIELHVKFLILEHQVEFTLLVFRVYFDQSVEAIKFLSFADMLLLVGKFAYIQSLGAFWIRRTLFAFNTFTSLEITLSI
jgi:hypothetical protein